MASVTELRKMESEDFVMFGCDGKGNNDTYFKKKSASCEDDFATMVCGGGNNPAHY